MSPRPETADLHRRILAAAARSGFTPESFARFCERKALSDRLSGWLRNSDGWVVFTKDGHLKFLWLDTPSGAA